MGSYPPPDVPSTHHTPNIYHQNLIPNSKRTHLSESRHQLIIIPNQWQVLWRQSQTSTRWSTLKKPSCDSACHSVETRRRSKTLAVLGRGFFRILAWIWSLTFPQPQITPLLLQSHPQSLFLLLPSTNYYMLSPLIFNIIWKLVKPRLIITIEIRYYLNYNILISPFLYFYCLCLFMLYICLWLMHACWLSCAIFYLKCAIFFFRKQKMKNYSIFISPKWSIL